MKKVKITSVVIEATAREIAEVLRPIKQESSLEGLCTKTTNELIEQLFKNGGKHFGPLN